jgi:hypothetical protein
VAPIGQTALPARSSLAVKDRPLERPLRTVKNDAVLPVTGSTNCCCPHRLLGAAVSASIRR